MSKYRGRGGVDQAISQKGIYAKKSESRLPVPGRKGQASSSPISEDGNDKELLKSICQLHRQIRADHTPAKDIKSAIGELKTEIQSLICELDDSEENTEAPPKHAKSTHDGRKAASSSTKPKATASGTNNANDLYTVATTTSKRCRILNMDLVKTRKELKDISELAVAVGQEVGFQPDTSNADKDSLSVNAKRALEDIKRMNKKLRKELNKLSKYMESYSTDQTQQQQKQRNEENQPHTRQQPETKKTKDQTEEKKDHKSSQVDTNLEIISKAGSSIDNLQQYKREMDPLVQSAIRLCMGEEDNPSKGESVFVQLTRAIKDIDVDLKKYHHLENEYRKLNQQLSILHEKITTIPTYLNPQQQPEEKQHKERKQQKKTEKTTDKHKHVKDQRENEEDRKESREGQKESRDAQSEASGQISPSQFDTNLKIVFEAVGCVVDLQDNKITYEQMLNYVWETTNAAASHIKELTSNNKGPGKFKIVKVWKVQSDEIDQFNQRVVNMVKDIEGFVERDTKSGDEIQKLKREIEIKVKEKEALHNRLSKLADNKMTEGNPNIAYLGDPYRPTKIAEIHSEIYENEWTDALNFCLQKLGKEYREDDALQALNKTLIICYKICQEKSDEWVEKTKGVLKRCSDELMVNIQSKEIIMQIIDGRKAVSDQMSKQLLKEIRPKKDLVATKYAKEMNSSKLYEMIIPNKFFEKCFTLCWKMIVQNPQMILVEGPPRGNTYDHTVFSEFTSSGSKVVFTVWPALYLHKGGPLLNKGVVKVE